MSSKVESQELSESILNFAIDLYQKCADESANQNIILSPLSIASALVLALQGAQKNTFQQIAHGLHLGADKATIAADFAKHYDSLKNGIGESTLSIANQIYVQQGHQIQQAFHDVAVKQLNSGVESVNFDEAVAAAQTINSFVANKTNNKITNLISSDSLGHLTRLVLVNAIYFKGHWEQKFPIERTSPGDFYIDETKTVTVDYMRNEDEYRFAELSDLDASALELKYAKSNISFVALLPNSRTGLPALEASLKNYDLSKIMGQMYKQKVEVTLPKFKIEYEIELSNVLKKLGMSDMFGDNADFGGLLESPEPLKVSKVIHKAFIDVTEQGSEAAAATAGLIRKKRSLLRTTFEADHPFVYFILSNNNENCLTLFCGSVRELDDIDSIQIDHDEL